MLTSDECVRIFRHDSVTLLICVLMLKAMKESVLSCLFGGFTAHSQCSQQNARDRSPHEKRAAPAFEMRVDPGSKGHRQVERPRDLSANYRKIENTHDVSPTKRKYLTPKRPRYILDLKSDIPYLESDFGPLDRSRSPQGHHQSIKTEADIHVTDVNRDYHPVRGILKKSQTESRRDPEAVYAAPHIKRSPTEMRKRPPRSRRELSPDVLEICTPSMLSRSLSPPGGSKFWPSQSLSPPGGSQFWPPQTLELIAAFFREHEQEDGTRKREAFLDMLARRYPQYADRISASGVASEDGFPVRGRRPRDHHRRATTVVTYNPEADYDNRSDTMSNIEGPTFQRGGWLRNSMPHMRSPQYGYDRNTGVVFLVMGEETKKAELPNEITHLDTVRALFVRSFPGKLTMEYMESPKRKIYILDAMTNIYYQLEDLQDIKDRTVLRLYECDSTDPQKVRDPPPEIRGKQVQTPRDATPPRVPGYGVPATAVTDQVRRAQTLPGGMTHSFPPYSEYNIPGRSKSADRSRSLPRGQGPDYGYITYHSPDRIQGQGDGQPSHQTTADRPNLRPIPENLHYQNGHPPPVSRTSYHSRSPPVQRNRHPPVDSSVSPPSSYGLTAPGAPPQTYVAKGVKANTVVSPLRATGPVNQDNRNQNRHSLAFTPLTDTSTKGTRSQSYRVPQESTNHIPHRQRSVTPQPTPSDPETQFRMEKMEEQIASLAAWVQTAVSSTSSRAGSVRSSQNTTPSEHPGSTTSMEEPPSSFPSTNKGLSDVSSGTSQNTVTQTMKDGIMTIKKQTSDLKTDLRHIRRMHQLSKESLQESIHDTMKKIANALRKVPGAEHQLLRQHRFEADIQCQKYLENKAKISKELSDLEGAVEELREDVISRQCHVNMSDVEGMALMLSNITKSFGDLKVKFPQLQQELKRVMAGEMEVVVNEEKFLKEEPEFLEDALKRCKRLTGTLFTLKRLASVQQHRIPHVPQTLVVGKIPSEDDKKALLDNIKAVVPNHETRVKQLQAADASRERKKKIVTQQEALKFGKSLEIASRMLKPSQRDSESPESHELKSSQRDSESPSHVISDTAKKQSAVSKTTSDSVQSTVTTMSAPALSTVSCPVSSLPSTSTTSTKTNNSDSCKETIHKPGDLSAAREEDARRQAAILAIKKDVARAAFFSSMTTPPSSPAEEKRSPPRQTMDYTVHISPVKITSTGETRYTVIEPKTANSSSSSSTKSSTTTKPSVLPVSTKFTGEVKSGGSSPPTPSYSISQLTKSSPTSIPRFSVIKSTETTETSKVTRKLKTSTPVSNKEGVVSKIPSLKKDGQAEGTSHETKAKKVQSEGIAQEMKAKKVPPPPPPRKSSRFTGQGMLMDTEVSVNGTVSIVTPCKNEISQKDCTILGGHPMGIRDSGNVCTSTPKPDMMSKPSSKFEREIMQSLSAQGKSKDQESKVGSSERETKDTEGTQASTSSNIQGAKVKVPPPKKPKPPPPKRKSSLSHSDEQT